MKIDWKALQDQAFANPPSCMARERIWEKA